MIPTYHRKSILVPHCPQCGEQLRGNGSVAVPYECKCGIWEFDFEISKYKITKE
jgi:tRNA(Ile2) C34 agmatinyltransferase TiaS